MSTDLISMSPDFLWCHNNGVFAVLINSQGRFARFIQRCEAEIPADKVWIFGNPEIKSVNDTTYVVNEYDLRAFHGNVGQWMELKEWMRRNAVTYQRGSFHVPNSNGKLDHDLFRYKGDEEHTYLRDDNPQCAIEAWLQVFYNEAQDAAERDDPEMNGPSIHWP